MAMPPLNGVGHAGKNGAREYKYATLQDVLKSVMPPLIENGVLLTQGIDGDMLKTTVRKGAEMLVLDSRSVPTSGTPQELGSAETYAKRYALCTVFCIAGMEDDDGQAAGSIAAPSRGPSVEAAKRRMWEAIKKWAELHGEDVNTVVTGVQKRKDWTESVEFFDRVASEFESDLGDG